MAEALDDNGSLESTTVGIYRTAATVKGGRRFSFAALVVVGDRQGRVGIGYAKAGQVPNAIEKAQKEGKRKLNAYPLQDRTVPHLVEGRFGACRVRLVPASPGTGVIAGASVRAILEMLGIQDCLTKCYGSTTPRTSSRRPLTRFPSSGSGRRWRRFAASRSARPKSRSRFVEAWPSCRRSPVPRGPRHPSTPWVRTAVVVVVEVAAVVAVAVVAAAVVVAVVAEADSPRQLRRQPRGGTGDPGARRTSTDRRWRRVRRLIHSRQLTVRDPLGAVGREYPSHDDSRHYRQGWAAQAAEAYRSRRSQRHRWNLRPRPQGCEEPFRLFTPSGLRRGWQAVLPALPEARLLERSLPHPLSRDQREGARGTLRSRRDRRCGVARRPWAWFETPRWD